MPWNFWKCRSVKNEAKKMQLNIYHMAIICICVANIGLDRVHQHKKMFGVMMSEMVNIK